MKINKKYIGKFQKLCLEKFEDDFDFFYRKHFFEVRDYHNRPYSEKLYEQLDQYH